MKTLSGFISLALAGPLAAAVITPGQTDTFESGTAAGWTNGGGAADPVNIATGGPAGAGDNFLRITSDGSGAGGKLTVFNQAQWAGDFTGANAITADLANLGATPLTIRISLRGGTSGGAPAYVTSDAITLPADGVWRQATFRFSSLVPSGNPAALPGFLGSVVQMRIFHSTNTTSSTGTDILGTLGVDNLAAVPEPASALLLAGGLAGMTLRRRRGNSR